MKFIKILTLLIFISELIFSQSDADILVRSAKKNIDAGKYNTALKILDQAKKVDAANVNIYFLYGEIYAQTNNYKKIEEIYTEAADQQGEKEPLFYLLLGNTQKYLGEYDKALNNYKKYLAHPLKNPKYVPHVKKDMASCEYAKKGKNNPVPFNPVNLGAGVNSKYSEYLPSLNAEENIIVFTRRVPGQFSYGQEANQQEDFYWSHKNGSKWGKASALGGDVNTDGNEGAQALSANGKYLFFTACHREDGLGGCDIYLTRLENGRWLKPMNLGSPVNTKYWESQPSISPDSKTLYFTSDRPGGYGKLDLWKSTIKNGKFSEPVNLGPIINTPYNEASPFIHLDNKTLYFSSTGHLGYGGYDIFVSKKINDSTWTKPKNLGYPINTEKDENSLIVNAKGTTAYYASDKKGGYGQMDLYSFSLYKEARPTPVSYFKGIITDKDNKKPLSARFELIDLSTDSTIITSFSDKNTGSFLICIPTGINYALNVSKDGYVFYSDNFFLENDTETTKPFIKNIQLTKIKTGAKLVLNNIFFDTDSYVLKQESNTELHKLIDFLNKNKSIKIEIGGHTDNRGSKEHNKELSENRAKSVYTYLINKGIGSNRLSYKGYGDQFPIADNNTAEGQAKNRRTEFKIIEE